MDERFEFIFTGPLEVEETTTDSAILGGTFLRLNKVTNNGREYQVEEGEEIASALIGMPVNFGSDPLNRNKHLKTEPYRIGRVISAWLDRTINAIRGKIEIWNTKTYPDIVSRIKKGWGFSIGGRAQDMKPTGGLNRLGRAIMKVFGMKPNHLQLLHPAVPRGQAEAQVEDIYPVEETLAFDPCPWGLCELPVEESTGEMVTFENKIVEDTIVLVPLGDANENGEHIDTDENIVGKIYILEDPDSKLKYVE